MHYHEYGQAYKLFLTLQSICTRLEHFPGYDPVDHARLVRLVNRARIRYIRRLEKWQAQFTSGSASSSPTQPPSD